MAWSTGPAFGFPKLGSPASPRLCLLVVYRWSLGCANPSVSLFCADQCTYRKHWSFTNSTANLSKVLGGKFTNIKHFFFLHLPWCQYGCGSVSHHYTTLPLFLHKLSVSMLKRQVCHIFVKSSTQWWLGSICTTLIFVCVLP